MALDQTSLGQLRAIVRSLQASNTHGAGASLAEVVRLARQLHLQTGLTVDFEATSALGQPLVVVRVPGAAPPLAAASLQALTPREREIAQLVAAGLSNKEIARELCLSVGTIKHYVHQILDKTGLRGRVAIATAAQATPPGAEAPPIQG